MRLDPVRKHVALLIGGSDKNVLDRSWIPAAEERSPRRRWWFLRF
ncbi:hypothetical protein ATKI12_7001 [Kitasatospora sp. Ki12]